MSARSLRSRAYTVVEVMASLAVLGLGSMSVIALQKVTLASNVNARHTAQASAIAQAWQERIKADILQWNKADGSDLNDSVWVKQISQNPNWCVGGAPTTKGWMVPATNLPALGVSTADVSGLDLYNADAPAAFCTHVRFTQLYPSLIRVEVRVFWDKGAIKHVNNIPDPVDCAVDPETVVINTDRYGSVYTVSAVLQSPTL